MDKSTARLFLAAFSLPLSLSLDPAIVKATTARFSGSSSISEALAFFLPARAARDPRRSISPELNES